jgi:hypothetical protein
MAARIFEEIAVEFSRRRNQFNLSIAADLLGGLELLDKPFRADYKRSSQKLIGGEEQ